MALGLVAVYSSSFVIGYEQYGTGRYFVIRQAMWALVGIVLLAVFARVDYHRLRALCVPFLVLTIGALAVVFLPGLGLERNGATRWLALGPLPPIQPSEFAKLAIIIYIAAWASAKGENIRRFSMGFLPFIVIIGFVGGLVMREPDMGTTVMLFLIATTIFFLAGAPLSHMLLLALGGGIIALGLVSTSGYRADRLTVFLTPDLDPQGVGFHTRQLLIALGSGGIGGLGLGASRQKFGYIPGSHTDGVFAIIGEEMGFIGGLAVILLLGILVWRGLRVARRARDSFGSLLALGVTFWIAYQSLINIGGVTRSIPLTGIPLPFISYGGSALATLLAGVGIVLNVSRHPRTDERPAERGARPPAAGKAGHGPPTKSAIAWGPRHARTGKVRA